MGGTSAGAPQWAGLIALSNEIRAANSLPYLSGNNLSSSLVYSAATDNYAGNFNDVTSGSNGTGANTSATVGYDFVTGLGSPVADSLVTYLATH